MDFAVMVEAFPRLLEGVPLTLGLALISLALGIIAAVPLALARTSGIVWLWVPAYIYVFIFRGTPLLVQIFLIYYGLGQFEFIRDSVLWIVLKEAFWCAIFALTLNTAAYGSEIIRGGLRSIHHGQVEAAKACGMNGLKRFRRIILPQAFRQALPAYGNEVVLMVKATSLASIITMMEITGIARRMISQTFAPVEIFIVAGAFYLLINFFATRAVKYAEYRFTPYLRPPPSVS